MSMCQTKDRPAYGGAVPQDGATLEVTAMISALGIDEKRNVAWKLRPKPQRGECGLRLAGGVVKRRDPQVM